MYAKPELTLVGSAANLVLGGNPFPGENVEPQEEIDGAIATNMDE